MLFDLNKWPKPYPHGHVDEAVRDRIPDPRRRGRRPVHRPAGTRRLTAPPRQEEGAPLRLLASTVSAYAKSAATTTPEATSTVHTTAGAIS